jgi:hypothetical protein
MKTTLLVLAAALAPLLAGCVVVPAEPVTVVRPAHIETHHHHRHRHGHRHWRRGWR